MVMTSSPAGNAPLPTSRPIVKKSKMKRLALICGSVIIALAAFVLVMTQVVKFATAGPEAVVHTFLAAGGAGNYAAAYACFSAPLKQVQSFEEFSGQAQANSMFFKVKDTTFSSRSIDTTSGAELAGSVTLESGTQVPASFKLVRENGQWKLLSYHIGS